jgi:hypothetical protein
MQPALTTNHLQLKRAFALACKYGHGWSYAVYDDETTTPEMLVGSGAEGAIPLSSLVGLTLRDAEKLVNDTRKQQCFDWPGIELDFDHDGDIRHETGTGRLTWNVLPDGRVHLTVWRPGPMHPHDESTPTYGAVVSIDGDISIAEQWTSGPEWEARRPRYRHIIALAEALSCFVPDYEELISGAPGTPFHGWRDEAIARDMDDLSTETDHLIEQVNQFVEAFERLVEKFEYIVNITVKSDDPKKFHDKITGIHANLVKCSEMLEAKAGGGNV